MSESSPDKNVHEPGPDDLVGADVTRARETLSQSISGLWWLMLLRGLLLMALGVYAMFLPGSAAKIFVTVLGIFLIADGVFVLMAGLTGDYPGRAWIIVRGIISIVIGIFVFAHPAAVGEIAATVILYIIAFGAIVTGLFEVVSAIVDRDKIEGGGWLLLSGGLAILFGVMMFMAPLMFAQIFVRVLGVFALVYGISLLGMAVGVRRIGQDLAT